MQAPPRLLLLAVCFLPGCILVETAQEASRQMTNTFTPRSSNYRDTSESEQESHQWDFVGDEARPFHGVEKDPDPWFKKWFYSEQARSIERNLGVD